MDLMDTLLNEITNIKPMRNASNSFSRYAARILSFVNNMEQIGCAVTSTSEAPFLMSQLLSKLDASDNIEFGREMLRMGKEENVLRWLPRVFTNNPSYLAYVTEGNLVTLSLRFCSQNSPLRLPI